MPHFCSMSRYGNHFALITKCTCVAIIIVNPHLYFKWIYQSLIPSETGCFSECLTRSSHGGLFFISRVLGLSVAPISQCAIPWQCSVALLRRYSLSFISTCTIFRKTTISTKCTIWAIYLAAQQYFKITIYQPTTYFTPIIVQNSLKLKNKDQKDNKTRTIKRKYPRYPNFPHLQKSPNLRNEGDSFTFDYGLLSNLFVPSIM